MNWKTRTQSFHEFFEALGKRNPTSLQLGNEVLKERATLQADITLLHVEVHQTLKMLSHHTKVHEALSLEVKNNALTGMAGNITYTLGLTDLWCANCNKMCDKNCTLFNRRRCLVEQDNKQSCKMCNCLWTDHKLVLQKYAGSLIKKQSELQESADNIEIVTQQIEKRMKIINQSIQQLQKIALRPRALMYKNYVDAVLENISPEYQQYLQLLPKELVINLTSLPDTPHAVRKCLEEIDDLN